MSIELPSLEKSYGRIMTACGELKQPGSRTGKGGERKPKVARYQKHAEEL